MRTLSRLSAAILVALLTITVVSVSLASTADAATGSHKTACRSAHFKHAHPKRYHRLCQKRRTSVQVSAPTVSRPGGFSAPTTITYLGDTCTHPREDYWVVTALFEVTGGRYANIGDMAGGAEHYDDNVYNGESRIITRTINIYGWAGPDPSVPTAESIDTQQMIAPIDTQRDRTTWVMVTHNLTVNLSCP